MKNKYCKDITAHSEEVIGLLLRYIRISIASIPK